MPTPEQTARELREATAYRAADLGTAPISSGSGLYAWWHLPGDLGLVTHGASGPTTTEDGTLELAYVGIASSLRERLLRSHLASSTGSSTLRRALGAWLGPDLGWVTEWRSGRVQHEAASEDAITSWMSQHLFVTWTEHPDPDTVEPAVITLLRPPMNHQHNQSHPNWRALDHARRAWRAGGTP